MSTKIDIQGFLESGGYLPKPLRDFHDSKEIFKMIHATMDINKNEYAKDITWVSGQCYVIDIFLWFMARRGWTLQRSRVNAEFRDLSADINEHKNSEAEIFRNILAEHSHYEH